MKKLLLFLLFTPLLSIGQKKDTTDLGPTLSSFGPLTSDGSTLTINTGWPADTIYYDTAKVIMLVCDTAKPEIYSSVGHFEWKHGKVYMNGDASPDVWWQFGYIVTIRTAQWWSDFIAYLDADKKPLPKSLVVWMAK